MTGLALACAFTAAALLALSMRTHGRSGFGRGTATRERRFLAAVGWAALATVFVVAIYGQGWAIGIVLGFASLAAAGFVVTLVLTYRARLLPVLAVAALLSGALGAMLAG